MKPKARLKKKAEETPKKTRTSRKKTRKAIYEQEDDSDDGEGNGMSRFV